MRKQIMSMLMLGAIVILAPGCATSEQWQEWRRHPTHFASGQHIGFSLRNAGEHPKPNVRQSDMESARSEKWWGEVVLVSPDQIFQD